MDYETKLYLDNLIEVVEKLDSPDWWIIVLTIINIGAFIFVAYTQIKLQKQQTQLQKQQVKAQEYDIYKTMFSIVEDANDVANKLLNSLYRYFSSSYTRVIDKTALVHLQDDVKVIEKRLKDSRADFKLKLLHGNYQAECYIEFMKEIWGIIQLFIHLESDGYIQFIADDNDYEVEIYDEDRAKFDTTIINALVERIQNDKYKASIKGILISYSNRKNRIIKLDIAGKIKDNC